MTRVPFKSLALILALSASAEGKVHRNAATAKKPAATVHRASENMKLCVGGTIQSTPTGEGKNDSYCSMIADEMKDEASCANQKYPLSTKAAVDKLISGKVEGMEEICPGFDTAEAEQKRMALQQLVASEVVTESQWNPEAVGDDGRSHGLLQLTAASDKAYGCSCAGLNDGNITDPKANLSCGTHIFLAQMARDMTVGKGSGKEFYGAARSFGPLRDGRGERTDLGGRLTEWCERSFHSHAHPSQDTQAPANSTSGVGTQR